MSSYISLIEPRDLVRTDLPRLIRPDWASSLLERAWDDHHTRHKLLDTYQGDSLLIDHHHDRPERVIDELVDRLESGELFLAGFDNTTFDPIAEGTGNTIRLINTHTLSSSIRTALETALKQERFTAAAKPAAPPKAHGLSFEESVKANNKYFGAPTSAAPTPAENARSPIPTDRPAALQKAKPGIVPTDKDAPRQEAKQPHSPPDVDDVYILMPDTKINADKLVAECYGELSDQALKHFNATNPHLRRSFSFVMPAQPVVVSPWSHSDKLAEQQEAQQAVAEIQAEYQRLSPGQIKAFQNNHDGITNNLIAGLSSQLESFMVDARNAEGSAQTAVAWAGGAITALGAQADGVARGLGRVEAKSLKLHRSLKGTPKANWAQQAEFLRFKAFRDAELKKIRNTINAIPLTPSPLRAAGEKSLKKYTGLNNRYIYRWRNQNAFTMPKQFATIYSLAMRFSQGFGVAGRSLFVLSAIPKASETVELCTIDNADGEACARSAVRNGAALTAVFGIGFATTYATTILLATTPVGWGIAAGLIIGGVLYGDDAAEALGSGLEWLVFDTGI